MNAFHDELCLANLVFPPEQLSDLEIQRAPIEDVVLQVVNVKDFAMGPSRTRTFDAKGSSTKSVVEEHFGIVKSFVAEFSPHVINADVKQFGAFQFADHSSEGQHLHTKAFLNMSEFYLKASMVGGLLAHVVDAHNDPSRTFLLNRRLREDVLRAFAKAEALLDDMQRLHAYYVVGH